MYIYIYIYIYIYHIISYLFIHYCCERFPDWRGLKTFLLLLSHVKSLHIIIRGNKLYSKFILILTLLLIVSRYFYVKFFRQYKIKP